MDLNPHKTFCFYVEIRSSLAKAEILTKMSVMIVFHKVTFICAFYVSAHVALSASEIIKVEEQPRR